MAKINGNDEGRTVTVRVPISIRRRGGRKIVLAPDGTNVATPPICRRIDSAMVKAIARAFRWRKMLENGTYATIAEIAAVEKINLRRAGAEADAAGAGHCGSDTRWTAAGADNAGGADATISGALDCAEIAISALTTMTRNVKFVRFCSHEMPSETQYRIRISHFHRQLSS
jgi:hypothetical protein